MQTLPWNSIAPMFLAFFAMGVTKHAFDRCERHFSAPRPNGSRQEVATRVQ
jgi:hypothetical protein